jgi:uncharacterized damage-inducible protein DinB
MGYERWFELVWRERHRALDACADMTDDEWLREFGFASGSLRGMFEHIVEVERSWVQDDILAGGAPPPDAAQLAAWYADPRAARRRSEEVGQGTRRLLAGLDVSRLGEKREASDREGAPATFTVAEILMHVITHELRHHGHVQAMFRLLGRKAPNLDWI